MPYEIIFNWYYCGDKISVDEIGAYVTHVADNGVIRNAQNMLFGELRERIRYYRKIIFSC